MVTGQAPYDSTQYVNSNLIDTHYSCRLDFASKLRLLEMALEAAAQIVLDNNARSIAYR